MSTADRSPQTRDVATEIEIAAPVGAVWSALTDQGELTNWFPLQARVEPQLGGEYFISWDETYRNQMKIVGWEPERKLGLTYKQHLGPKRGDALTLAIEFTLEARGEATILRLVHSGFGADASWDGEYDGVRRGWSYELRSLRHYLERHAGSLRRVAWAMASLAMPWEDAWAQIWSADGLEIAGGIENLSEGDAYSIRTSGGLTMSGVVKVINKGMDFAGTVQNMNEALFRVELDNSLGHATAKLWLATYGTAPEKVAVLQDGLQTVLVRLFG